MYQNEKTTTKIEGSDFYKNSTPFKAKEEAEWKIYKHVLDTMLEDGFINHDEWLFCMRKIREKLGLINAF